MRFRHVYMGIGTILVLLLWAMTDPDHGFIRALPFGASTVATIVILLKSVLYVGILHLSRKALLDYLDLGEVFKKAMNTSEGAGYAAMAIGLIMISVAIVMYAATTG